MTKPQLTRLLRRQVASHLFDESGIDPHGIAIYSLSDPRDVRAVRYVGQTRAPRRRLMQHVNSARLWLPAETPWWIAAPKLRPLYSWIRELFQDGQRFPVMLVTAWVSPDEDARLAERSRIFECLAQRWPLLNFEAEISRRQMPLL